MPSKKRKFKIGDKVRIIGNSTFVLRHFHSIGEQGVITYVVNDETVKVVVGTKTQNVNKNDIELVVEPEIFGSTGSVGEPGSVAEPITGWTSTSSIMGSMKSGSSICGVDFANGTIVPVTKTNKLTMKKIKGNIKRMLSKDHQALYKAGYINGELEFTDKALAGVMDIMLEKNEAKLVELAKEEIKIAEEEKK